MARSSTSSWSEDAPTLPPGTPEIDDSDSNYSFDGESLVASCSSFSSSYAESPWIIEHILERRSPDEQLPLRVMFSFNSGQGLPTLKDVHQWWHFRKDGQKIITFLSSLRETESHSANPASAYLSDTKVTFADDYSSLHCPFDRFMDPGNQRLLKVKCDENKSPSRRASQGLPPNFVEKMVLTTIFRPELKDVDFKQALAGLDYLRDFEDTRRCCLREAAHRLGIKVGNWRDILGGNVRALEWVEDVLDKESTVEGFYSRIYINLRIWTMMHELKETGFYRPNVLAMLNTLFPPSIDHTSNMPVKVQLLQKHRASLYSCMVEVESQPAHRRARIVESFVAKYLRVGTSYSWQETRIQLEKYMRLAESMIRQAKLVQGVEFFNPHSSPYVKTSCTFEFKFSPPKRFPTLPIFKTENSLSLEDEDEDVDTLFLEPMPERPKIPLSALLLSGVTSQSARAKSRQQPRPSSGLHLIPERSPLRYVVLQKLKESRGPQTKTRPRFHARCHSETTLLRPFQIRETATPLGSTLVFQNSDLCQMILNSIKAVSIQAPKFGPSANPYPLSAVGEDSMAKRNEAIAQPSDPFRCRTSESSSNRIRLHQDYRGSEDPHIDLLDPVGVHHRRADSSWEPLISHTRGGSRGIFRRPSLRKDSSALRNVENVDPSDELSDLQHSFDSTTRESPSPSPPKLKSQSSFRNVFQRKDSESAAYVEERFPSFDNRRIMGTPSLSSQTPRGHSTKNFGAAGSNRMRNASFVDRPSTSMSQSRDNMVIAYSPSSTLSSEAFSSFDRRNPLHINIGSEKVVMPLQEFNEFTGEYPGLDMEFSRSLRKQSSFAHLERPSFSIGGYSRYDRPYTPCSPLERTATSLPFSRTPTDIEQLLEQKRQPLKKQRSFGFLEGRRSKNTTSVAMPTFRPHESDVPRSPFTAPHSPTSIDYARETPKLKSKPSFPSMRFRSKKKLPPPGYLYYETNDPNERLIITRPETPFLEADASPPSPKLSIFSTKSNKRLRKTRSVTSLRSQSGRTSLASTSRGLFRKKSREVVLTSADIDEPFPPYLSASLVRHLNSSELSLGRTEGGGMEKPSWWAAGPKSRATDRYVPISDESYEEFNRKEYARRWYLEEARARRWDMNAPKGGPLGEVEEADDLIDRGGKERGGGVKRVFGKKVDGNGVKARNLSKVNGRAGGAVNEMPRATKKEFKRPERTRMDGIFGLRFGKGKEKAKLGYVAIDVGKFER